MGFLLGLLSFLKSIPTRAWAIIIGIVLLFTLIAAYSAHERAIGRQQDAATIAALQAQILALQAANASGVDAVAKLQASLQQCQAGRTLDQKLTADAKTAYDAQLRVLLSDATGAKQRTAQLLAGECKTWASLPSCVSSQ